MDLGGVRGSAAPAAMLTGPDNRGKGFTLELAVTEDDIDRLVKAILDDAKGTEP